MKNCKPNRETLLDYFGTGVRQIGHSALRCSHCVMHFEWKMWKQGRVVTLHSGLNSSRHMVHDFFSSFSSLSGDKVRSMQPSSITCSLPTFTVSLYVLTGRRAKVSCEAPRFSGDIRARARAMCSMNLIIPPRRTKCIKRSMGSTWLWRGRGRTTPVIAATNSTSSSSSSPSSLDNVVVISRGAVVISRGAVISWGLGGRAVWKVGTSSGTKLELLSLLRGRATLSAEARLVSRRLLDLLLEVALALAFRLRVSSLCSSKFVSLALALAVSLFIIEVNIKDKTETCYNWQNPQIIPHRIILVARSFFALDLRLEDVLCLYCWCARLIWTGDKLEWVGESTADAEA